MQDFLREFLFPEKLILCDKFVLLYFIFERSEIGFFDNIKFMSFILLLFNKSLLLFVLFFFIGRMNFPFKLYIKLKN